MTARTRLTAGRIAALACPPGKSQAFLWDTDAPALLVRASPGGRKTYAFESRLHGATVRITIGDVAAWTLDAARQRANALRQQTDAGIDPREVVRQQAAERQAAQAAAIAEAATVAAAWADYLTERQPHWGERHYADHVALARAGGKRTSRGTQGRGKTLAGPLHYFMPLQLRELTPERVEAWAAKEAKARPTQARLALRILRAFLNWCAADARYSPAMDGRNATSSKKVREALGKPKAKADALLREQLAPWFEAVRNLPPTAAAYLQGLLLTGTRPTELRELQWEDLNWQWKGLTVRDKVEGERVIPLTPYLAHLLAGLPRRGPYVFAGIKEGQPMSRPHRYLVQACAVAGIEGLTLHGLRRSFGTLSEWLEIPAGVVAQIQGHKPSATAEKHYRVRPLDLLRLHHERIEAWILEQAGVQFDAQAAPGALRVVAGK